MSAHELDNTGHPDRADEAGQLPDDLRLYVAGHSPKSVQAIENLRGVREEYLSGRYAVELVDLLEHPKLAQGDEIIAVPTLVRRLPEPVQKIIGDLSDTEQVLIGLQLRPGREPEQ